MKKILLLVLTVALALSCFASCSNFGGNASHNEDLQKVFFISPEDEEAAVYTAVQSSEDGLKLEVTLHGYKSESLGKAFYVKNNEYFLVDVKLTNESDTPVYQFLPTSCRDCTPAHNHEISFDLASGESKLNSSSFGFVCAEKTDLWTVKPGESYEWQLKLAAGEQKLESDVIFPSGDKENTEGGKNEFGGNREDAENGNTAANGGNMDYVSDVVQGGTLQIYETNYIGGNFFSSDLTFDPNASVFTSYYFTTSSPVEFRGYLPADGDNAKGLLLYGTALFPENVCTFEGPLSFAYMKAENGMENTLSVSVPLTVEVVYVSNTPNAVIEK